MVAQSGTPYPAFGPLNRNRKYRLIRTIAPTVVPSTMPIDLPRDSVLEFLRLRLNAVIDIAAGGGADGALAPEQPLSLLREIRITGSSGIRHSIGQIKVADFAALAHMNAFLSGPQALSQVPLAAVGIQTTAISACVDIPFQLSRTRNPRNTWLNGRELDSFQLAVDFGAGPDIEVGGTRVHTFPTLNLDVFCAENLDPELKAQRYGVHCTRYIETQITGANAALPVNVKSSNLIRGFLIKQFTRALTVHTPVDTVINSVRLDVNRDTRIQYATDGVANSGWMQLRDANRNELGYSAVGYGFIDLCPDGNYDAMFDSSNPDSVELIFDVNAIATSWIRVYPIEVIDRSK